MPRFLNAVIATVLLLTPALAAAGEPTQVRNDTGQVLCYDDSGESVACESQDQPGQDGRFGRDSAATAGALPKIGAGAGGFDFMKVSNNGDDLRPGAAIGPGPDDWACTRDNLTGRLWEIKTNDEGIRHFTWSYNWYDPDDSRNGGDPGEYGGYALSCNFTLECNTYAYIQYVNSIEMCGRSDWRLPTLDELIGIVNFGSSYPPGAIDISYFPDGGYSGAWTSDTAHEPDRDQAWAVNFDDGHQEAAPKGGLMPIRVVSAEPYVAEGPEPMCGERENRQIPPNTAGAFHHHEDGTTRDERTGLIWQRCSFGQDFTGEDLENAWCEGEPEPMNWEQALHAVAQRNAEGWLGASDWRMPNIKELASIQERQCSAPPLDVSVFPNSSMEMYWSSTSYHFNGMTDHVFTIANEFGAMLVAHKHSEARLLMVRGGGPFDGYQGEPTWRVGGTVSGMVGTGLGLQLALPDGSYEALTAGANGAFAFTHGFLAGETYAVTVSQAPVPFQACTVANGSGAIADASVDTVVVTCAAPEPPQIEVTPEGLSFMVGEGGSAAGSIAIGNVGGGFLHWDIDTAHGLARAAAQPAGVIDCGTEPGIIIHDDGSAEGAYAGNANWAGGIALVDKFTPASYPASIRSVCVAFTGSAGVSAMDFEIVVLADNGSGGGPGTELGALPVSVSGLPQYPVSDPIWSSYDISSLYTTISSGSLYVGVRWLPALINNRVYLLSDESDDREPGHAGGYYWNRSASGLWMPTVDAFAGYRSMLIRATVGAGQELPLGCDDPHAITWLEVTPATGRTPAGGISPVDVAINTTGLDLGSYAATLCIHSDTAGGALVEVPVNLTVAPEPGQLEVTPGNITFDDTQVGSVSAARTVVIANVGAGPLGSIAHTAPDAPFQRAGGSCPQSSFDLEPGQSCTIDYVFSPLALGPGNASVTISSVSGSAAVVLSGNGLPGEPAQLVVISGDAQEAIVGQPFDAALAVEVRDVAGNPLPGVSITFDAPPGGASAILSATVASTGTDGRVSVTASANEHPGSYVVVAILPDGNGRATFALVNLADEPADRLFADGFEH